MDKPHALYRFYDSDGALLYVGITLDPGSRWKQHAHDKPWWTHVAQVTVENHPDRATVLEAERAAIIAEKPRHNVIHNRVAVDWLGVPNRAEAMPDDCHDHCAKAGIAAVYHPYRWADGIALYECVKGHRWTCHWGGRASGSAPANRGVAQWLMVLEGQASA